MKTIILTIITVAIIAAILAAAIIYIVRSKKKGRKCIGCPEGGCKTCSCHCQGIKTDNK